MVGDRDSWNVIKDNRFSVLGENSNNEVTYIDDNTCIDNKESNSSTLIITKEINNFNGEELIITKKWVSQVFGSNQNHQTIFIYASQEPAQEEINSQQYAKTINDART